jgi:hypothetical protein
MIRRGLANSYPAQELQNGSVDAPALPVNLQTGPISQNPIPPNAIYVGQYTYTSAAYYPLTGGPVGKVPAAVVAAAKVLGPKGTGSTTVGQFYLSVSNFEFNEADYITTIDVYALPDSTSPVIVQAPPVGVPGSTTSPSITGNRPLSPHFLGHSGGVNVQRHPGGVNHPTNPAAYGTVGHSGGVNTPRTVGAPPMQPSWRPHNGLVPKGLGAAPKLFRGQWLARRDNRVFMHPRAGFGAVSANDALATAIIALLSAISTSSAANGGTALCSDVTAAATAFQSAYNAELGGTLSSNTYDSDTVAALNTAIAAYNPSGSASIQSFSTGSAPPECSAAVGASAPSGSSTTTSTTTSTTPATTPATASTTNYTPYYVAGAAAVLLGGYYLWAKKII